MLSPRMETVFPRTRMPEQPGTVLLAAWAAVPVLRSGSGVCLGGDPCLLLRGCLRFLCLLHGCLGRLCLLPGSGLCLRSGSGLLGRKRLLVGRKLRRIFLFGLLPGGQMGGHQSVRLCLCGCSRFLRVLCGNIRLSGL